MKSLLLALLLAQDTQNIPVTYSSPGKGFLSLALYDEQGVLVRTLLTARAVEAGPGSTSWDATTDLGSLISQEHRAKVESYLALATQDGGKIACGGKRPTLTGAAANGAWCSTTPGR